MTAAATTAGYSLDSIIEQLDRFHQRATYGAVAQLVNSSPRSLMTGRERNPQSSWIVSVNTGQPTGYGDDQKHPALTERGQILRTGQELKQWMDDPR